ncbi:MAG: hypothetical protein ABSG05_02410 [Candidatus Pacearchaeota archaeon]|jgi:ribosomal protein S15P/S13E
MPKEKSEKAEKKEQEASKKEVPEVKKEEKKKITEKEYEAKIVELAKTGLTSEKIGEALRHEGIHPKEHGKISKILKEKKLYQNPDIKNIREKLERVTKHKEKNAQDKRAMRERERIFSLLRKQEQYHNFA